MADPVDPSASEFTAAVQVLSASEEEVDQLQISNEYNGEKEEVQLMEDESSTQIRWTTSMVKVLLHNYIGHQDKFMSMEYNNRRVWQMIAEKLKDSGYMLTGEQCDIKWRNLKKTYKRSMERLNSTSRNRWEFFADMNAILSPKLVCHPVTTASSFQANGTNSEAGCSSNNAEMVTETTCNSSIESSRLRSESAIAIHWNVKMVNLLLSSYTAHQEKFYSPQFSNNKVWQHIAGEIKKNGYALTGEQCNAKWRNLKKCYLKTKFSKCINRQQKNWPFFHDLDRIMSKNPEFIMRSRFKRANETSPTGRQNARVMPGVEPQWFTDFMAEKRRQHEELLEQRRKEEENRQAFRESLLQLLTEVANKSKEAIVEQESSDSNKEKRTRYEERLQQKRVEQENKHAFRETLLKLLTDVVHKG